jgi:membrane-associated phospholipid phosphatase
MVASSPRFPISRAMAGGHRVRYWAFSVAILCVLIIACYLWIDRPVVLWVRDHQFYLRGKESLEALGRAPNPLILLAGLCFLVFGFAQFASRALNYVQLVVLVSSTSLLVGEVLKDLFKWVFGRPSPDIWLAGNVSADGDYHFHWFRGAEPFNAFPSGHMTAAAAVLGILWMCYPQFRVVYAACGALAGLALVAFNFHFVGDVVAGALLGTTVSVIVLSLFERSLRAPQDAADAPTESSSIVQFRHDGGG